ncbi:MAG: 4-alpha-glucanotransferase, partial [Nannocystaceae bacterium]
MNVDLTHSDSPLHQLAREHGIERSYIDISGEIQVATPEVLRAVLKALGIPAQTDAEVDEQLRLARRQRWSRPLDPVIVAWRGEGTFSLHLPAELDRGRLVLTLTPEDGGPDKTVKGRLEDYAVAATDEVDGRRYVARQMRLPGPLPHGAHRLHLRIEGKPPVEGEAVVLAAPVEAFVPSATDNPRPWGVFLPLYALHSERSAGAGDLGDLGELMRWVGEQGGAVVGTLPLLAAFLDEPFEWSPYAPASRLAWNELYMHLEQVPEYRASAKAQALYEGPKAAAERARLAEAPLVEYREQMAFKRRAIESMAEACFAKVSARAEELATFAQARPELDDYARFRAVTDRQRKTWPQWPQALRDGTVTASDFAVADHRYHLYAQWIMHQQLEALGSNAPAGSLGLYLDLPVGVNGCSYDTWKHPDLYVRGLSTGAPPDTLFG